MFSEGLQASVREAIFWRGRVQDGSYGNKMFQDVRAAVGKKLSGTAHTNWLKQTGGLKSVRRIFTSRYNAANTKDKKIKLKPYVEFSVTLADFPLDDDALP